VDRELQEYSTTLYLRQVWREHGQRRQVWRDERLAFGALDDNHGRSVTPFIRHFTSHNFGNFSYPPRNLPFYPGLFFFLPMQDRLKGVAL